MTRIDRHITKMDPESGVSEIIGSILLISLVVVALAIIGALLFSQQTPQKIPNVNFMTGTDGQGNLLLFHNGGDSLTTGNFSVNVDQVSQPYTLVEVGNEWSLGKTLKVTGVSNGPHTVQIIYTNKGSGGGDVLLRSASANISTIPLQNTTSDELPVVDCSAISNPTCFAQISPETISSLYMTNTTRQSIRFMQANQARGTIPGAAGTGYHFNFTVSSDSTLIAGATGSDTCANAFRTYYLKNGDKVGIVLIASPDSFYIYGTGSQIWYMNVGDRNRVTIQIKNQTTTTTLSGTNALCNANITGYTALDSTIDITTATANVITYLKVNNTYYIDEDYTPAITINNIKPIPNGLFLVNYGAAGEPIFFVGGADSITGISGPLGL